MYKVRCNNGPYLTSNLVSFDNSTNEIVFLSLFGYDGAVKTFCKDFAKANSVELSGIAYTKSVPKAYEITKHKPANSDYAHAVIYRKDFTVDNNGDENITTYIYTEDLPEDFNLRHCGYQNATPPPSLCEKIFEKLYATTPVPLLKKWMPFLLQQLVNLHHIREIRTYNDQGSPFRVFQINIRSSQLFTIVSNGLKNGVIAMNDISQSSIPSEEMQAVTGLDTYLNNFSEILASRIQGAFRPKFIPGQDKYDNRLLMFADWVNDNNNKKMSAYPAQMDVVQATVNNLKKSNVSFIIGEQGSGKSIMSLGTIFTHAKKPSVIVIMAPGHLMYKWQNEIAKYCPLSESIIINDFEHLLSLESKIKQPKRSKHLFLILSKDTAKFGYDLRPAAIWSKTKRTYTCPECGRPLWKIQKVGKGRRAYEERVFFDRLSFTKQLEVNSYCMNQKYNPITKKHDGKPCRAKLWAPMIRSEQNKWIKLNNSQGWVEIQHMQSLFDAMAAKPSLDRKETEFFLALTDALNAEKTVVRAPRKYPIARYIRERLKGCIDYAILDELICRFAA